MTSSNNDNNFGKHFLNYDPSNSQYRQNTQNSHVIHNPDLLPLFGNIYFHGASQISAEEIWSNGLWLSTRKYPVIWMTNDFTIVNEDISFAYSPEEPGRILVLELDELVAQQLEETALPGSYYLKLADSLNAGNYYHVEGLNVIYMLDHNGEIIKSK